MKFHRPIFHLRTAISDEGGICDNGPFRVVVPYFGFKLKYSEDARILTVPFEVGLGGYYDVGTSSIRQWDGSPRPLSKEEIWVVERNLFSALDYLHIRYTNSR